MDLPSMMRAVIVPQIYWLFAFQNTIDVTRNTMMRIAKFSQSSHEGKSCRTGPSFSLLNGN
jgi:hypothetical protein